MSFLYTAGCRLWQAANRAGRSRRIARPSVEEGTGAVFSVAQVLRTNRLQKPMIVASRGTDAIRDRVVHALEESDLSWSLWEMPDRPVNENDAEELRMRWVREVCDSFVLLGDEETMDFGKTAAALAAVRGRSFASLVGARRVRRRLPPVVAIPTAPGSGAEALSWAALPDANGVRQVIDDPALVPPFLVLDPELMDGVTRPELAAASINGLCLAVEAYLSGYGDDGVRALAADAVRGYFRCVEPCWNNGGSGVQRSGLMEASRQAGEAASLAGAGYARALCRAVVRATGQSFGDACAAVLPAVLEKYGNRVFDRLANLADVCGAAENGSKAERAAAFIARIRQISFRIGLPEALEPLPAEAAATAAELAAAEANPAYACPVVWTAAELAGVLRRAGDIR